MKRHQIFILYAFGMLGLIFFWGIYYYYTAKKKSSTLNISMNQLKGKKPIIPLAVLGSGPAGLSAALYGARSNIQTVVFEGNKPGGALMETTYIENWPGIEKILGPGLIEKLRLQVQSFGVQFAQDAVERIDASTWPFTISTESGETLYALSIILAMGSTPKKLAIPGEDEYWGKGVTTCAICDAPYHAGSDVIVVGGGDSAAEEALQLSPHARSVTILVRKDYMRASAVMQERIKAVSNITVKFNREVQKIIGDDTAVTHAEVLNAKTNEKEIFDVTGIFLAIGHEPNTQFLPNTIDLNEHNYIMLENRSQKTSIFGIFAAGDAADPVYKQAVVAAGDGVKAALDAGNFLQHHGFNAEVMAQLLPYTYQPERLKKAQVQKITLLNELHTILDAESLVFVDFYAPFCPSCMQMLPVVEQVAYEYADEAAFIKVDTGEDEDISSHYHVGSIPCLLVFKDGQLAARYNDAMSKKELREFIETFI